MGPVVNVDLKRPPIIDVREMKRDPLYQFRIRDQIPLPPGRDDAPQQFGHGNRVLIPVIPTDCRHSVDNLRVHIVAPRSTRAYCTGCLFHSDTTSSHSSTASTKHSFSATSWNPTLA